MSDTGKATTRLDDSAAITNDQQLGAELTSLRFLADAYDVLIIGPVGAGQTFLANALSTAPPSIP